MTDEQIKELAAKVQAARNDSGNPWGAYQIEPGLSDNDVRRLLNAMGYEIKWSDVV